MMKRLLSFVPVLLMACQTPAYPAPGMAEMMAQADNNAKKHEITREEIGKVASYLQKSAILYSVKCEENRNMWFCEAPVLLDLLGKLKEIKHGKPHKGHKRDIDKPPSK